MSVYITTCTQEEVPHISKEAREDFEASIPPFLRDARIRGLPFLGTGLIYQIPEEDIRASSSAVIMTDEWPRGFAMDVGWNRTAALWFARDPVSKVVYAYDCHYQGREEPGVHANSIRSRGAWIPGVIDPAANGRNQKDGTKLLEIYRHEYHLDLTKADNSIDAGITKVWQALSSGMLKILDTPTLEPFWREFRNYRTKRKQSGDIEIVKKDDHLMDCMRYAAMSLFKRMRTGAGEVDTQKPKIVDVLMGRGGFGGRSWMSG